VLSLSIQIEIDGVLPWRKALVSSPELLVRAARGSGGRAMPDASSS